jgi:membrane-associated phospholipid phosphatase
LTLTLRTGAAHSRHGRGIAIVAAIGCTVGAALTAVLASSRLGVSIDRTLLRALGTPVYSSVWFVVVPFDNDLEAIVALFAAVGSIVAYVRVGRSEALLIASTVLGSTLLAEALKRLGVVPQAAGLLGQPGPSWPSAHAAAITATAVTLSVLPRNVVKRRLAAVGGATIVLICDLSLIVVRSHRPSDLLGGTFIACAVAGAGTAVLRPSALDAPRDQAGAEP